MQSGFGLLRRSTERPEWGGADHQLGGRNGPQSVIQSALPTSQLRPFLGRNADAGLPAGLAVHTERGR